MTRTLSESWVGSLADPIEFIIKGATVREEWETISTVTETLVDTITVQRQTGRKRRYISFTRTLPDGTRQEVVDLPEDALTKSCDEGRHDKCLHRLGGAAEGGVLMKGGLPGFTHRCGCFCHRGHNELELEF